MTALLSRPLLSVAEPGAKVRLVMELEDGSPKNDATIVSELLMALATERGSCPSAPDYGSRLFTIAKIDAATPRRARISVLEAWKPWIDRGELRNLVLEVTPAAHAMRVSASFVDRAGNPRKVAYTHNLR